jgi:hypothetical protein
MRLRAIGVVFVVAAAALVFRAVSGPAAPATAATAACPPSLDPRSNAFLALGGPVSPLHLRARGGSDVEQIDRCGLRYDAGLDAGAVYEDASMKVEVLASNEDGSYQVRVTRK